MSSNNDTTDAGMVIVGVDGSQASKDALRWALRYARQAGATVDAVMAWHYPTNFAWVVLPEVDLEGDTRRALKATIEEVAASSPDATLLMVFAGIVSADVGIRPFGYGTSIVVTIALWLTLAPAIGAIARAAKKR